ncbi:unnamed protein product [Pleuronectes platessa]|uniref:Uncharacterized protein n=1 Tax=Pleuronectes platessa TaxID=8262 RepID=A0A9N7VCM7_PLEPL|nr:unnamed protein product [Pleuronectes platessa]
MSLVGGEADTCLPYRPWSCSQGAWAASPTCPASGETLRTTTPICLTSGEPRGGGLASSPCPWGRGYVEGVHLHHRGSISSGESCQKQSFRFWLRVGEPRGKHHCHTDI